MKTRSKRTRFARQLAAAKKQAAYQEELDSYLTAPVDEMQIECDCCGRLMPGNSPEYTWTEIASRGECDMAILCAHCVWFFHKHGHIVCDACMKPEWQCQCKAEEIGTYDGCYTCKGRHKYLIDVVQAEKDAIEAYVATLWKQRT